MQLAWNSRYCACGGLSVNVLTGEAVAVGTGAADPVPDADGLTGFVGFAGTDDEGDEGAG
ncbi:hypothetical protein GCM10009827_064460 [Dactylosporangium maewongense]|uniref:Uncharacterized protein n=1 Tax=Dactylosporangium maewongense TaxID=634393 RepID=A0ABN2BCC2_9ACTN